MRSQIRCSGCGRMHKKSHENKVGTDRAYSPDCTKYKIHKGKSWYRGKK